MTKTVTTEQRAFLKWVSMASLNLAVEKTDILLSVTDAEMRAYINHTLQDGEYPLDNGKYYNTLGVKYKSGYEFHLNTLRTIHSTTQK